MLKRIKSFLAKSPGTKAKVIAGELQLEQRDVNRFLHQHTEAFEQDASFGWHSISDACRIEFGGFGWLDSRDFEKALSEISPLDSQHASVTLMLKSDCKPLLEFLARLLALCNQLVESGKAVTLDLQSKGPTLSYLDRIGFFGLLDLTIVVLPERPAGSLARTYQGNNSGVIEFRSIDPTAANQDIPLLLQDSFVKCAGKSYSTAAFTVLTELFRNVEEHCGTQSKGFACLQFYQKTEKIQAIISDNGLGIVGTLLPVLASRYPSIAKKTAAAPHAGVALLTEVFSNGRLSQMNGDGRGLGLKASADAAKKYRAKISVRQRDFEFRIHHGPRGVTFTHFLDLATLNGTHICFEFKLD